VFSPVPILAQFRAACSDAMALRPSQIRATSVDGALMIPSALSLRRHDDELLMPVLIMAGKGNKVVFARGAKGAGRAVSSLRCLERFSRPRWPTLQDATRRVVGLVVLLLLAPAPLSNTLPGLVLAVIASAYLQRDGLLLSLGQLSALVLFAFISAAAWSAASATLTSPSSQRSRHSGSAPDLSTV
jgi:hypothetical protein